MGSPHEGSIRRPIAQWANALTTELHERESIKNYIFGCNRTVNFFQGFNDYPDFSNKNGCLIRQPRGNYTTWCKHCSIRERDVAQSIACPPLKRSVVGSILLSGPSCSLGYFPFQPVVHNWFIKGRGMYCSVYGKVHIKDPLLLIEKSSLCGHMNDVQ